MRTVRLTLLSALEAVAFGSALVYFLYRISSTLTKAGGAADSYLAKISFGVRAIEKETSSLAPEVTALNQGLGALVEKLGAVDGHLDAVVKALGGGETR